MQVLDTPGLYSKCLPDFLSAPSLKDKTTTEMSSRSPLHRAAFGAMAPRFWFSSHSLCPLPQCRFHSFCNPLQPHHFYCRAQQAPLPTVKAARMTTLFFAVWRSPSDLGEAASLPEQRPFGESDSTQMPLVAGQGRRSGGAC